MAPLDTQSISNDSCSVPRHEVRFRPNWDEETAGLECSHEELLVRVKALVLPLSWRLGHDHAASEDLVQEVFLKVFLRIASFRGESTLETWIHRIAINEALDARRWYRRHCGREVNASANRDSEPYWHGIIADSSPSPFEQV